MRTWAVVAVALAMGVIIGFALGVLALPRLQAVKATESVTVVINAKSENLKVIEQYTAGRGVFKYNLTMAGGGESLTLVALDVEDKRARVAVEKDTLQDWLDGGVGVLRVHIYDAEGNLIATGEATITPQDNEVIVPLDNELKSKPTRVEIEVSASK